MKNILEEINSRPNDTEERMSELENRIVEITEAEQKKRKRIKRSEKSLRNLWHNMKRTNICIIGVAEGEEREKGAENISEDVIAENFPNLVKYTEIQVQEAQRAPNRINPKRIIPIHIVIKMTKIKDKERLLKAASEKQQVTYKGTPIRLSAETLRPEGSAWYI